MTPGRTRVVGVRDGTAVVLAPELITELYADKRNIMVGVATSTGVQIAGRGAFSPRWRQRLGQAAAISFVDGCTRGVASAFLALRPRHLRRSAGRVHATARQCLARQAAAAGAAGRSNLMLRRALARAASSVRFPP